MKLLIQSFSPLSFVSFRFFYRSTREPQEEQMVLCYNWRPYVTCAVVHFAAVAVAAAAAAATAAGSAAVSAIVTAASVAAAVVDLIIMPLPMMKL